MPDKKEDITGRLNILGHKVETMPSEPVLSILETFPNRFPERLYMISMAFPEFTSLCPVTGQPDFGTIVLEYMPDQLCLESKSFKIYLFSFRSQRSFMETITNNILSDMIESLAPYWCRVKGLFAPRGATHIHVFAEYLKPGLSHEDKSRVQEYVENWRRETHPHHNGL